jgi:hypothetical protein
MSLEKLEIEPQPPSQLSPIEVLFNPTSYSISKSVSWTPSAASASTPDSSETERNLNAPRREFSGGGSRTVTLELFFDVTEPIGDRKIDDVREKTQAIAALTRIERDTGEPPICALSWGGIPLEGQDIPFKGFVTNLVQNFLLFDRQGKPVRARLDVTFSEFIDRETDEKQTDPELTTHVVKRGDTLQGIAARVYRDPTRWRAIAAANRLDDPRHLEVGRSLSIPELS